MFFPFLKLYEWHQIVQRITYIYLLFFCIYILYIDQVVSKFNFENSVSLNLSIYLLVVSSPCSSHSGLDCNLPGHWSDGISSFRSVTSQTHIQVFLSRSSLSTSFDLNFGLPGDVGASTLKLMIFFVHDVDINDQTASVYSM